MSIVPPVLLASVVRRRPLSAVRILLLRNAHSPPSVTRTVRSRPTARWSCPAIRRSRDIFIRLRVGIVAHGIAVDRMSRWLLSEILVAADGTLRPWAVSPIIARRKIDGEQQKEAAQSGQLRGKGRTKREKQNPKQLRILISPASYNLIMNFSGYSWSRCGLNQSRR